MISDDVFKTAVNEALDKLGFKFEDKEYMDVKAFQQKFGHLTSDAPTHLTRRKLQERIDCITEELKEFIEAADRQDLPAMADALIDLDYFVKGTGVMMGLPWRELWDDVQRANMSKERGAKMREGRLHLVDAIKPEGWQGPRTLEILMKHGYDPVTGPQNQIDDNIEGAPDEDLAKVDNI